MLKQKIIVLCGPTASGKTAVAIEIAKNFHGEIISADSMQVYRYMDIGTAKPTASERAAITHHMIDIIDPDESFDAAKYSHSARKIIKSLREKRVVPIVTGGTGLYIKALVSGLFKSIPFNTEIRERLKLESDNSGQASLYKRLRAVDPETAKRINPNDLYRIIRALEVYESTGKPISVLQREHLFSDSPYEVLKIGLDVERKSLYQRIDKRCDNMIEAGFIDEVKNLLQMGYSKDLKAMQSIGYRHMANFLEGAISWDEALRTLKRDTRRYAKRQLTWFKKDCEINWINPEKFDEIVRIIKSFLYE